MSKKIGLATVTLFSLLLGVVTWFALGALNYLPYSSTRDAISDGLASPGGFIRRVFFIPKVHTPDAEV